MLSKTEEIVQNTEADTSHASSRQKEPRSRLNLSLINASVLVLRVGASLAIVAVETFVLFRLVSVNATTAGFLYLVAILVIATKGGEQTGGILCGEALTASSEERSKQHSQHNASSIV